MAEGVLERVEHGVVDPVAHQQRADRDVAAGERLRDRHQVGLEAPVLGGEQPPRAPEPGLHLVEAEERPVAAAQLLRAFEVAVLGQDHALAEHGSTMKSATSSRASSRLERVEVVERHPRHARQVRPEAVGEGGLAVHGERAEREPVEGVLDADDAACARSPRGRA